MSPGIQFEEESRGVRTLVAIACLLAVSACGSEPRRPEGGPGDIGILGAFGSSLSSGRPGTQSMPPIQRTVGERDRPAYLDKGTGQFVGVPNRRPVELSEDGRTVSLNFVDIELQEFVRAVFDEILRETVVIDSGLTGRVTIRTSAPVTRTAALDLVRQALQGQGASLTKAGAAYRVSARTDQRGARRLGESIRIVPVRYIGAEEAKAALAPFVQSGVDITASPAGHYLTIFGPPAELDNLEQVLATLDVDQLKGMSIALLPLREASAASVASELQQVFGKGRGQENQSFRTLAITRMNAVLLIASQPNMLAEARKWVSRLDRADRDGKRIYVYPVQNRRAPEIAKILNSILERGKATSQDALERAIAPQLTPVASADGFRSPISSATAGATASGTGTENGSQGATEGRGAAQRVTADVSTNSIVVTATPDEWKVIEAALRRLDVLSPQVLIEATIAEVRLNDSLRHGVRWYFETGSHGVTLTDSDTGSLASVFPGFNYVFGTSKARVVLNALEQVTDVEIVSSPALTVLDNQTAKLQVGDQVPMATRSATSVVNPDSPIVNDITLKDTGVILSVTPRVNASGLVMLEITQEVSDVVPTTTSTLNSPTIRQRRINSSVAVHSGTEIVLGGLIGVTRTKTNDGVPGLMDIPLLGNAFRSKVTRDGARSELLVILRPTVLGNRIDIQNVTSEIKSRMSGATKAIYR